MKGKNYYRILGVSKDATKAEIKSAYRKLAKQYHPDVNQDDDAEEMFKKITEAYQTLIDDNLREEYDRELRANRASSSSSNKHSSYSYNNSQQYSYNYNRYPNYNYESSWVDDARDLHFSFIRFLKKSYIYLFYIYLWPITLPIYLYKRYKKRKTTI